MKRTIPQIISNKILDNLENLTLSDILIRSLLLFIAIFFTLAILFPATTHSITKSIMQYQNYALLKTTIIFATVFNFQRIMKMVVEVYNARPTPQKSSTGDTIEGIPTLELLDHLFEHKSFKREDIETKFAIPRNRYATLANKMESIGILKRGENNSRVLNEEYTRADIASIFKNVTSAKDLKQVFRQIGETSFTKEPQKESMLQRLKESLAPLPSPPRFERKLINQ